MPQTLTFPGVYVEEISSGVRTITGVSTSDTAFVDFFARGPVNDPVRITSFADFQRRFGGLDRRSAASYALQQYYLNGGQIAYVVRVTAGAAAAARATLVNGATDIVRVDADNPGKVRLVGDVDYEGVAPKAAAITPVPGGVGPVTVAMLLRNTVLAAEGMPPPDDPSQLPLFRF